MGLEESPHCPFDVMEACRTGDLDTGSGDRGTRFRLPPGRWWWRCGRDGDLKSATRNGNEQHSGDGGAAEEMDRDEADDGGGERARLTEARWAAMSGKTQQRNWRVKQAKKSKWLQTKP
jgi:hypothetical protein